MGLKEQYENNLKKLLENKSICKENRDLFKKFFEEQEYKLKRKRKLNTQNDKTLKTLVGYVNRLENVNVWFNDKPWSELKFEDIKKVYDDLEDGKILNRNGKPFKDKSSYYNKIMKSKPFELAGKDKIAKEVIITTTKEEDENDKEVRFITEEDFKKTLSFVIQPKHKLAFQLGWDIGENVTSICQLIVSDFERLLEENNREPYYNVRLRKEVLKTGRTKRTEPTLYSETTELLDILLQGKEKVERLFDFDKPNLEKLWKRAILKSKIRCKPDGQIPSIKDIRSGMACHLLDKNWTTDEIKSRLGHKPSSSVIDKYVNYKAKSKTKTKTKLKVYEIEQLKWEMDQLKELSKLDKQRMEKRIEDLEQTDKRTAVIINLLRKIFENNTDEMKNMVKKDKDRIKELLIK